MGGGHHQSHEAAPRRGASLKRPLLAGLIASALLVAVWGAGGVLLFDRLAHDHGLRLTAQTAAVRAWLDAIRRDLSREASLLARDRAVTEGTSGGDWSRIAQDATPRLRSLTLDGFADFVAIFDAEGMRLAQAPSSSPLTPADLASLRAAAGTEPTVRLAAVSEHLWALAAAPVEPTEGRVGPAGLVVVGRRLERQGPGGHATQLAWSGTSPALSARLSGEPDVPADLGADGRVMVDGRAWRARRLDTDPQGELWALVPAAPLDAERRRLWELWLGSLALALAAPIAVAWVVGRGRAASGLDLPEARKLGALYAGAMGGAGVDLVADAEQILDTARSFAQLEEGMVYRIQPTGGTLVATAARGLAAVPLEPLQVRPLGGSHAGEAVRTGRPVVTLGTTGRRLEPDLEAHAVGAGHRMTVSLPIRVGGTAWGALTLMGRRERPLELAELSLLETMADQVGLAASRATLFAEAQETGRRLETLTRLAQNLTATLSMEGVLQRLVDAAVELFGSSISRLWLLDDSGATLSLRASAGTRSSVQGITELKVGEGLIGKVVASRQPVVVADARTDPRIRNTERIRAEGSVSIAVVALHLGDRVLGGLSIAMREAHAYTAEELRLLQSLADQAAIAIDNARLFAAEQTRRAEMASLLEINQKIGALDPAQPEPLLQAVAEEAARLLDVDNAGIRLVEGDDLVLAGCAGTARQTMLRKRIKIGESFSGKVVERGESMIVGVGTIADMVPEHGDAEARLGYTTSLGVPLRMADRTIGVLAFRGRRAFTRRDQEVAEAFAGQAAIALEHSRLYREAARHAERMVALADLGRLVSETLDPAVVSRRVTDSLCTILGAGHATLYRVEASSGDFVVESTAGAEPPFQWAPRLPPGDGLVGVVMRDRRAAATADSLADDRVTYRPEFRRALADVTHRALLVAPLRVKNRTLGALAVSDRTGRRFGTDEIQLAQAFADHAALALENAQLYSEATRRRREAEELARLSRALTETLDPVAVGDRIVDSMLSLFAVQSSGLRLLEPDGSLVVLAMGGRARDCFPRGHVLPPGISLSGRAVAEGRPVTSNDIFTDAAVALGDDTARRLRLSGDTALLAVPLRVKERIIGALSIGDRLGRVFTEAEIALLQALADQAALALENARLFSEESARRARSVALADVEREFAAELDRDRLVRTVIERAGRLFDATGAIYLVDGENRLLRPAVHDDGLPELHVAFGEGAVGRCAEECRPYLDNDYPTSPDALPRWIAAGVRRVMGRPVLMKGRLLGVVALRRPAGTLPFREYDLELLDAFAAQAAIALENADLYAKRQLRADRLRTLARLNQAVTGSLEAGEVLGEIVGAAARLLGAPLVTFWAAADETSDTIELRAASNDALTVDFVVRSVSAGQGGFGWVLQHRRPLEVPDVFADDRFVGLDWWRAHGLRAFHGIPILVRGTLLGILGIHGARLLTEDGEERDLLETFVAQAAIALENARLFSETTRRLEETRALLDLAAILNSSLDARQVLKQVARRTAQVCRVDRCSVERRDGDRLVPLVSQFADGRRMPAVWSAYTALSPEDLRAVPALAQAIDTQQPVVIEDVARSTLVPAPWADAFGLKSCVVLPLVRQGEVIGTMSLDAVEHPTRFASWQIDLATAIAGQFALWLANSQLYAEAQERLSETSTLLAVSRALSQPGPPATVMRLVAREVARAFGADMIGAYFLDEHQEALVPLAGYRVPPEHREFFVKQPLVLARSPWLADAWRSGRAAWSSDSRREPGFDQEWAGNLPPYSVLFAAALAHGTPVGGLFLVWWRTGRTFLPSEIRLLEGVAAQVGLAMENIDLVRQTQQRLAETETLLSISRALASTLDLDALLRMFLKTVAATVGADCVGLWTLSAQGEWLEGLAGYHVPPPYREAVARLRLSVVEHDFFAEAARTRRPVYSTDVMNDPRFPDALRRVAPHRSHLFVPIVANERMVGGFGAVWWERPRDFAPNELALMDGIASQAGAAIENARLFAENRRQVEELSVLHDLSRAVTGELDRAAVLGAVRDHIARVLDVRNIVISLRLAESADVEVVLRVADSVTDGTTPVAVAVRALGLMSVVLSTGRSLRTNDYEAACRVHGVPPYAGSIPLRYWVGVPLRGTGDHVLGVLVLRGGARPFTESDERLLANIGHLAALALASGQLFEERARAYRDLTAAQDQLVRTEKLRALGEMAAGVAHDFNNLLASILGRAQLLLRRVSEPQLRQWLEVIERASLDGAQTVRRLREFTRVRREQALEAVDLSEIVRDALEITQSRWHDEPDSRGIVIALRTDLAPVPPVAGDPGELREAMTNLILNAVDAMPEGGTLGVTTRVREDLVLVEITDTGVGMSPEVRARIFDPFFTTKGPQGTGLGLSMTYGILARHGAGITVESEEGKGSLFRLSFTCREPATRATPAPAVATPPSAALRCLVVDDEAVVASVLGDILSAGGHQPTVLGDGAVAIERVRAEPFDAVFTDLSMPVVSGWQVARAVKETRPGVPVFLVTGFAVDVTPEELRERGVDAVLSKPLQIHEILDAAAGVARHRGAASGEESAR